MSPASRRNKRRQLLELYGNQCHWCNKSMQKSERTIEHLLPKSLGGSNALYRTHLRSFYAVASLFSISLIKQSLSLAFERASVRSKFLTKLLHLSTQAFERSITHLAATDTNPDCPLACFSAFDGLAESSN